MPLTDHWKEKAQTPWNLTQPQRRWNDAVGDSTDGPRGQCAKRSVSQRKTDTIDFTYVWNLKIK